MSNKLNLILNEAVLKRIDDAAQRGEKTIEFIEHADYATASPKLLDEIRARGHKVAIEDFGFSVEIDSDSAVVNLETKI